MPIVSRAEWGARPPKDTPTRTAVAELFLHHSVGSGQRDKDSDGDLGDDYMRSMQTFHMDGRGWDDIAYNHGHDPDGGEFYEGRGFGVRPGAQCRHNTGTHALVVMGDFRRRRVTPTDIERIARFYHHAQTEGLLPRVPVQGHRDAPVTGDCSGTTCPGTYLYAALPAINARIDELHEEPDMSHAHKPMPDELPRSVFDEVWAQWVEASGTVEKSRTWDFYREDMAWVYSRVIRPLEIKVERLEARIAELETGSVPADVLRRGDNVRLR